MHKATFGSDSGSQGNGIDAGGNLFAYETMGCRMMAQGSPAPRSWRVRGDGELIQSGAAIYTSNITIQNNITMK